MVALALLISIGSLQQRHLARLALKQNLRSKSTYSKDPSAVFFEIVIT